MIIIINMSPKTIEAFEKSDDNNKIANTLMTRSKYPTSSSEETGVYGRTTKLPSIMADK